MTIAELLKLDGKAFVTAAYETGLFGTSDPEGVARYVRNLSEGISRAQTLLDMNRSPKGRRVRRISDNDLFEAIFACGPMAFIGFPIGESRLRRTVKIVFKKLVWSVFRYELWNLHHASVVAYEALEKASARPCRDPGPGFEQADGGDETSSLPYGVWKTFKELDS